MSRRYSLSWWASMAVCCVAAAVAIYCQPAQADDWTGKDATVTAAFGCLAAKFTSLIVGPNRIVFRKEF